ncbi:MAG: chloride channel protein [Gemmatimonadetes bacterium]|nr:chloride channel protein [Gemmatimonadota bacterium]
MNLSFLSAVGLPAQLFVRRLRAQFAGNENALFFVAVCMVGLLGGLAGAAFRWLFDMAVWLFWGRPDELIVAALGAPRFYRIGVPILGAGAAAGLAILFSRLRRDKDGFPEILEVISIGGQTIQLSSALERASSSLMTLASGGAVGREGPMGQIAAAIGSRVGRSFGFSEDRVRILMAAGIAAGFAAAYNTPIGATLFVMEVIIGSFNMLFFGPAIIAAAISTLVTRFFVGPGPIYPPGSEYAMVSVWEIIPYLMLGFLAGLGAVLFQIAMERMYRLWDRVELSQLARMTLGGAVIGLLAAAWPFVLGNGYLPINLVLAGQLSLALMATLFFVKMIATSATLASGGSGGIFTPTMFLGAMIGGVFGGVLHAWLPEQTGSAGAYALAGMSGLVAGTTHAPFLAIIMIFELTQNYAIVLPLMLTAVVAFWTSQALRPTSIYTAELRRRGMEWEGTPQERLMRSLSVRDIMLPNVELHPQDLSLEKLVEIFNESRWLQLYIGDEDGRFIGIVELHEVKRFLSEREAGPLIALDLVSEIPVVTPETSLVEVNEKLWLRDLGQLPVIDNEVDRRFVGIVTRRGVLGAFDREILRRNALLAKMRTVEGTGFDYFELPAESQMAKVPVPAKMVGKSLQEVQLRQQFGVSVIAIERLDIGGREQRIAPRAETVLKRGDALVVMGDEASVGRLRGE